jgi:dTDP-4-amino-4,6-dideoxygalactose transaminase
MPLHLSSYFKKLGFRKNNFPNSEEYQKKSISLPIFYDLKKNSVIKIVNLVKKIYKA